jgi:hypothetical protein
VIDGTWSPLAAPKGVDPESDVANGFRLRHHASDRLRWSGCWKVFNNSVWSEDEAGAFAVATFLFSWINAEAEQMRVAGEPSDTVARREQWARESQSVERIEAALKIARGLLSTLARPSTDRFEDSSPSIREQVLGAGLHLLFRGDDGLRAANGDGRLVATKMARKLVTVAPRLWPGNGEPPMGEESMTRLFSAMFKGELEARR